MKLDFYIKCMGCNGTRKLLKAANGGEYPSGMDCPLCEDGYHFAGISEGQASKLKDEVDRLTRENEELRRRVEWQPIETAPKDGTSFLALLSDGSQSVAYWAEYNSTQTKPTCSQSQSGYLHGIRWYREVQPVNWMPLPAVPEAKE